jgi:tetratricopeptide (TPR) repeat protein
MDNRENQAAMADIQPKLDSPNLTTTDLCEAGFRLLRAERHLEAQVCCQQALAIDAHHADSLHLMGLLSVHTGQYDHAVEWIARAIGQQPKAEYLSSLGQALQRAGRLDEAAKAFDKAVQLAPDDAAHWIRLGEVLTECARSSEAVLCVQHALKLAPRSFEAAWPCAVLLHRLGKLEEALTLFDLCEELQPQRVETIGSRALVLRDLKRFDEYLAGSLRAHALDPANVEICNNVGDGLLKLDRLDEALGWFDRALERRPTAIFVLENKATVLRQMHRFDEAFAVYNQILTLDPGNAKAELASALDRLLLGDFEAGWKGREARWRVPGLPVVRWNGPEPVWLGGESIRDKTLLVYSDEGLGDAIQFARYIPMLAERGARVVFAVPDALYPLMSTMPGLWQCLPSSSPALPAIDAVCPINSLPLAFATTTATIPPPVRLSVPADRVSAWEARLGAHDRLRVGLVWSGSFTHVNDRNRSISLRSLAPLLQADVTWVSLQKDPRPADQAVLRERTDIIDLTAEFAEFSDTAAIVQCLDLVITVDTSVAHLAGSLGQPTWIMLPHKPDYRWQLDRDDSPWYPTARLFRQASTRDYAGVIDRMRDALIERIAEWPRAASAATPYDTALGHMRAGRHAEAHEAARQSGILFYQSGRLPEALAAFELCDRLQPNHAWTIYMRAGLLYELGRPEEALVQCNLSAERDPDFAPTLVLRARCLHNLNRFDEALTDNRRAYALDPTDADVCNAIGDALQLRALYDEALQWFDRALALRENFIEAMLNKAFSLRHLHRFRESFAIYDEVKAIDPDNIIADWNLANLHLLTGNFEIGWAQREVRWKMPMFTGQYPKFSQPMWLGDEAIEGGIEGKTILVQCDQGFGDTIQLVRYMPMLAARGARVILVVEDALHALLVGMPGVVACLKKSAATVDTLPSFDMHCPMMRLPLAFGTRLDTIPAGRGYVPAPALEPVQVWQERLQQRLGPHDRLRVGVVWSGNPGHKNDHNRSITLAAYEPLLGTGAAFVSLQKDPRPDDRATLDRRGDIVDLTADLTDFADTAALISCLDLVITVDTAVAHLAGALGRPTWLLLPYMPDWRWLLDREDSPWYPTVRLFRQGADRDYAKVIDRVRAELAALVSQHRPG